MEAAGPCLPVALPPFFAEALGYRGEERLVAFFIHGQGDSLGWDDGKVLFPGGGDLTAWRIFVQHPQVVALLEPFSLGGSDEEDWSDELLVDRPNRRAYVVPSERARRVLGRDRAGLTNEEAGKLIEAYLSRQGSQYWDREAIAMQERLRAWLDIVA